jgi:hypothetical protein
MPLRPRSRLGGPGSLLLHVLVVLLLVRVTRDGRWWEPEPIDGPGLGNAGGGGSGRAITMIPLAPAEPAPRAVSEPVTPVPVPVPPAPVVMPEQIPPIAPPTPPPADTIQRPAGGAGTTGTGGGTGGGTGPGSGPGTGPGSGPGTGGTGTPADSARPAGRPPEPRQLILPPFDYPKSMRGRTIQVTFFVLADGKVDHVVFGDEIPDRGYARKLEDAMRAYRFRPARSAAGLPVPGHTTLSISF